MGKGEEYQVGEVSSQPPAPVKGVMVETSIEKRSIPPLDQRC